MIAFGRRLLPSFPATAPRTEAGAFGGTKAQAALREWIGALDAHEAAEATLAMALVHDSPDLLEVEGVVQEADRRLRAAVVVARRLAGS